MSTLSKQRITLLFTTLMALLLANAVHADEERFQRLAVIGASASAGFGVTEEIRISETESRVEGISLGDVLIESGRQSEIVILDLASDAFFMNPRKFGEETVQRVVAWKPDLVVGVDFLFWYVYGNSNHDNDPDVEIEKRLKGLEEGLRMLEKVNAPLVIGEVSDMTPAIGRMLSKKQVPSPAAIEKVNQRIHAWAQERPEVVVIPLHELIERISRGEPFTIGEHAWNQEEREELLNSDKLHPNLQGLVAITQSINAELIDNEQLKERMQTMEMDREILVARIRGTDTAKPEEATSTTP